MTNVYLCGGINGLNDTDAKGWRDEASEVLLADGRFRVLDPMARDYRGREAFNVETIVHGDLADIDACDVLLVSASRPSWGTAMEVFYAHRAGRRVFAFGIEPKKASPWLAYHTTAIYLELADALAHLTGSAS